MAMVGDLSKAYEGYPKVMIYVYGVGALVVTIVPSVVLALVKWPAKKHIHKPEDEHLLT